MSTATAPITRAEVKARLDDFSHHWRERIDGWRAEGKGHTEKSSAQQFWSDLFRCFGIIPERIDLFERDAARASTGNTGYIDLFWSGVVLGEAKSLGRDLDAAFEQALDYLAGGSIADHEFPKYIIVSDFENIRLTRLGEEGWTVRFTIDEITSYIDQLRFLAGFESVTKKEEAEASIFASSLMAELFQAMAGDEVDEPVGDDAPIDPEEEDQRVQRTSVYLTRLLFLLFGDDAGLWEEDLFYRFVLHHTNADNLGARLNTLFQVLNTPESKRRRVPAEFEKFPYVNGSIFEDHLPQEFFDAEMRDALLSACRFHWSRISPAVFGSMFQLVKSKEARRADGEHYTSEKNILKTIEPLFLDELRAEAQRLSSLADTTANLKRLKDFRDSLAEMIFCDPACGCGNFLVVAYRELRKIETDVIVEIRRREGQSGMALDISWEQKLNIGQFHGFELNWWPAKIAETAMFLVDHQANRELADRIGTAPDRLPIEITAHITHGNALELDWEEILPEVTGNTYMFGNPPFLGDNTRTPEQLKDLQAAWGPDKQISRLDYVTGWHALALRLFQNRRGAFALVTTNSITQGDQPARLFRPIFDAGWRIRFAHRTFPWDSEAPGRAAVHCVIVGFDRVYEPRARLWDYPDLRGEPVEVPITTGINAYLIDGPKVLVEKRSTPIAPGVPPAKQGSKPTDGGFLIVEPHEYDEVVADPIAAKYVRPYRMGRELVRGLDRWCLWLEGADPRDIASSPILKKRVEGVAAFRAKSRAESTRNYPYHHLFRQPQQPKTDYVGIPRVVSESRRYYTAAHLSVDVIAGDKVYTAEDPEGLFFALISSSMFITWQRTLGGRLKSDLSFSNTIVWNTFPIPEFDETSREKIIEAGQGVLAARALHPERSLADQYNPLAMEPALVKAHDALDRVVDKAMGATRKLTTERQRQEILFQNYSRLTNQASI